MNYIGVMKTLDKLRKNLIGTYYSGSAARQYEATRSRSKKWAFEEESIKSFFAELPLSEVSTIADIPVGTNRFSSFFETQESIKKVYGIDLSADMLSQAKAKRAEKYQFFQHDISLSPPKIACDTAVCFRFLNLFKSRDIEVMLENIAYVVKYNLILSVRLVNDSFIGEKVLDKKIYLHNSTNFYKILDNVGFTVRKRVSFLDSKGGEYFVILAVKKPQRDLS